jgi:hypothetical protein
VTRAASLRSLADHLLKTAQVASALVEHVPREHFGALDLQSLTDAWSRAELAQHLAQVAETWVTWRLGQCDANCLDGPEERLIEALTGEPLHVAGED